jgi:quinoprotein glucose dehydrogenase
LKTRALEIVRDFQLGALFTPPIVAGAQGNKATLMLPSPNGGSNWQGAAADPETGVLYVPSASNVWALSLVADEKRSAMRYVGGNGLIGDIRPLGLPLVKPPWGRITAIDLNTGAHVWSVPNGPAPTSISAHPAVKDVDLSNAGSSDISGLLVTKTLLFAGQGCGLHGVPPGSGGPWFRALDKTTGETIFQMKLSANQCGLPMTYMAGGQQYVVVAIGAQGVAAELLAFALP